MGNKNRVLQERGMQKDDLVWLRARKPLYTQNTDEKTATTLNFEWQLKGEQALGPGIHTQRDVSSDLQKI